MKNNYLLQFTFFLLLISTVSQARISLPCFFSSNMVLQRNMPVKIFGKADKNETIFVEFSSFSQKIRADKGGMWQVEFPAMPHGGPYQMLFRGEKETITFDNVMIGDVWLCSGQSNMEFSLKGDLTAERSIRESGNENIRLLTIPKVIETCEQTDIKPAKWQICTPETSAGFSAVGYFFGKEIQEHVHIPIGLINASWGGTDIETWTSWQASMNNSEYKKYKGKTLEKALGYSTDDIVRFKKAMDSDPGIKRNWSNPELNDSKWDKMEVPKSWDGNFTFEDGIIWFRKELELPDNVENKDAILSLGPVDDEDITWVNGKKVGSVGFWMAGRKYSISPGVLKAGKNTIVVRVKDTGGSGGINGSKDQVFIEVGGERYSLAGDWYYKPSVLCSQFGLKQKGSGPNAFASLLYNGMIHPLTRFNIKGVIWYQGENNAGDAYRYRKLFPNLIHDWRHQWGYEFPFLWVQLASYMAEDRQPSESEWAELREAQNMTLALPGTGQAVITDIGEAYDIHPKNKKDVGKRLAHIAENIAYGENVLASGPVFDGFVKEGNKLILSFSHMGDGLFTADQNKDDYVRGFAIAGEDRKFVWARAYIHGDKIIVFSDRISNPVAVRYGWSNNPRDINLINSDGLLASPFRSDHWPGITPIK